jgi:hypothetical protein
VIGTVFAMTFVVPLWFALWSGFYAVGVTRQAVVLKYLVPPRQTEIPLGDVAAIRWVGGYRARRLDIETRKGRHFRSASASASATQMDSLIRFIQRDVARGISED